MSSHEPTRNTFLAALPDRDRERVTAAGTVVPFRAGAVLHRGGEILREVWFPLDSVSSLMTSMEGGAGADVAIIGHEGLVGVTAFLGGSDVTLNEVSVQIGGDMLRVPLDRLRDEAIRSVALRRLIQRYAQALLVQTSQAAACNRFHSLDQRLGRYLLALHDRVCGDEIRITHERLGSMLGSFRPSVTLAAGRLQEAGIIEYTRGRITVSDRSRLVAAACECYDVVASEYARLLDPESLQQANVNADLPDDTLREVNSRLLITALREQEQRETAEQANDVAALFFATLSHELRTPLAAILGWADLLQSREIEQDTLALAIETIRRNAEAQRRLIDDMLDLARLRSGIVSLQLEPVDAATAARQAVASSRPAAEARTVAISVIAGEPVTVQADPDRLQQILGNLLSNALKFTPSGGAIEVVVTTSESQVSIGVRDNGRGIDQPLLPRVFEPFQHAPAASPAGELGLGLGLAIVRQLVALHDGTTLIESGGSGAGTTVTVVLPRADVMATRRSDDTRAVRA